MQKNMNLLVLKHKFPQKLLNLWHIFLLILTNSVDFNIGLRNVANFSSRGVRSLISCIY